MNPGDFNGIVSHAIDKAWYFLPACVFLNALMKHYLLGWTVEYKEEL